MSDALGALRARVRLERPLRSGDALGGASLSWTDAGDVWAEVRATSAAASADYDAALSRAGYVLVINRRADVRSGWRVTWGARVLAVEAVRDEGGARIELACVEETL